MNLPLEFENRMRRLLGSEYDAFYGALCNEAAVKGLRVNAAKVDADVFARHAPFDMEPLDYVDGGFIVPDDAQAGKHPYHHAGAYYMQDPGAMATVAALPREIWARQGVRALDLCAAPGGKTTQLAAALAKNGGMVLANEYNAARSRILAGNVERMGLDNVCVTNLDSKYLAEWYAGYFDLVVVDAPCSGEGMFRKNDLAISEWSPANVTMCAERQKEILENAVCCLSSGGYLLYSTCTYSTEENEEIVAWLLSRYPSLRVCTCQEGVIAQTADGIDITGGEVPELTHCRRFYPHRSRGEGQFMALLRLDGDALRKGAIKEHEATPSKSDCETATAFMKETIGESIDGLGVCGGNLTLFPVREHLQFRLPPTGLISAGVTLGEVRKGRIVPHHHFFMAYGSRFVSRLVLEIDDARVARYLAGEEIDSDSENGYTSVILRLGEGSVSLGGGKTTGGRLKNYYPKGLRVR